MPKIKHVDPQPKKGTRFLARAIMPSVNVLVPIAGQFEDEEGKRHPLAKTRGVIYFPTRHDDTHIFMCAVVRGDNKKASVIPFRGLGVSFRYSWDTIARHLNNGTPIKLDGRSVSFSPPVKALYYKGGPYYRQGTE